MTEDRINVPQGDSEWKQVGFFGNGTIYKKRNEGKLVTPGHDDFEFDLTPKYQQQIGPSCLPQTPSNPQKT